MKLSKSEALDNQFMTPSLLKALKLVLKNDIDYPVLDETKDNTINSYHDQLLRVFESQSESYYVTFTRLMITQRMLLMSFDKIKMNVQRTANLFKDYLELLNALDETASMTKFDRALHKCFSDEFKSHTYYIAAMIVLMNDKDKERTERQFYEYFEEGHVKDQPSLQFDNDYILAAIGFLNSLFTSKPNQPMFTTNKISTSVISKQVDSALIKGLAVRCISKEAAWRYSIIANWLRFKLTPIKNKSNFYLKLSEFSVDKIVSRSNEL